MRKWCFLLSLFVSSLHAQSLSEHIFQFKGYAVEVKGMAKGSNGDIAFTGRIKRIEFERENIDTLMDSCFYPSVPKADYFEPNMFWLITDKKFAIKQLKIFPFLSEGSAITYNSTTNVYWLTGFELQKIESSENTIERKQVFLLKVVADSTKFYYFPIQTPYSSTAEGVVVGDYVYVLANKYFESKTEIGNLNYTEQLTFPKIITFDKRGFLVSDSIIPFMGSSEKAKGLSLQKKFIRFITYNNNQINLWRYNVDSGYKIIRTIEKPDKKDWLFGHDAFSTRDGGIILSCGMAYPSQQIAIKVSADGIYQWDQRKNCDFETESLIAELYDGRFAFVTIKGKSDIHFYHLDTDGFIIEDIQSSKANQIYNLNDLIAENTNHILICGTKKNKGEKKTNAFVIRINFRNKK